jgi:hypothetical protein
MRIILSRKGFDSANGGVPSPILPNGELLSIPIPETRSGKQHFRYGDLRYCGETLDEVVAKLTRHKLQNEFAHPDPDLTEDTMHRSGPWKPAFGQAEAAEAHLQREGVRSGDLFLFFGWFQQVDAAWHFCSGAADLHVLFGWLQVGERIQVRDFAAPDYLVRHPHFVGPPYGAKDTVYVATPTLSMPGVSAQVSGAGRFPLIRSELILSCPGRTRSCWRLPSAFAASDDRIRLSYHRSRIPERGADWITFKSAGRGQEFVVPCQHDDPLFIWVAELFRGVS